MSHAIATELWAETSKKAPLPLLWGLRLLRKWACTSAQKVTSVNLWSEQSSHQKAREDPVFSTWKGSRWCNNSMGFVCKPAPSLPTFWELAPYTFWCIFIVIQDISHIKSYKIISTFLELSTFCNQPPSFSETIPLRKTQWGEPIGATLEFLAICRWKLKHFWNWEY